MLGIDLPLARRDGERVDPREFISRDGRRGMIGPAFVRAGLAVLIYAVSGYKWVIVIRALISWVSPDPRNPIVRALVVLTEPVLRPFRRLIPPARTGGIDFSPLLAFLPLQFLEIFLKEVYYSVGRPI